MGETSTFTNSTTPLVISCLNGFLDIASYLIEECDADVNEGGSVIIEKATIFDASPLWCAAANGHLKLVKFLVRCGASINKPTSTNSTPLRAACFDGYLEIVKFLIAHGADIEIANQDGHTSLMIAIYKKHYAVVEYLLERGADVNRTYKNGISALHEAAESGDLDIVKLVLKHGAANHVNGDGITPLLSAAAVGKQEVVEYIIEKLDCSKQEKVNALELLGAALVDEEQDRAMALKYWRQAMELRYENRECPLEKPIAISNLEAYLGEVEVRTVAEIEKLMSDPDKDRVEVQALVVRERILGAHHTDNLYYIKLRGARHADNHSLQTCLKLWSYVLCVQQEKQKPFSKVTYDTLSDISELRCNISNNSSYAGKFHLFFSHILLVFEIALKEIEVAIKLSQTQVHDLNNSTQFFHTIIYAVDLLSFMYEMQPSLNETQKLKLKNAASQLIHINPTFNAPILHFLTCFKRPSFLNYPMIPFPSSEIIDVVLKGYPK